MVEQYHKRGAETGERLHVRPVHTERELYKSLISLIMRSSAKLCVIPMQDYLGLGNNCRINTPSTVGKNWKWRVNTRQLSLKLQKEIQEMTLRYGRMNWKTVE